MLLNAGALNSASLNGPVKQSLFAFAMMVAGANVAVADPLVTRYCGSSIDCNTEVTSHAWINQAAHSSIFGDCNVLAAPPYQTFASASVVLSSAEETANADVTRYVVAGIKGQADLSASSYQTHKSFANAAATADITTNPLITRYVKANVAGSASLNVVPKRTVFGGAQMSGIATVTAKGGNAYGAVANIPGTATVKANAGYAFPSATIVVSTAQIFAYAKATRFVKANPTGTASMTGKGKLTACGEAHPTGTASVYAWVVHANGAGSIVGSAEATAEATYVHEAVSNLDGAALSVVANPFVIHPGSSIGEAATGDLYAETKINNVFEATAHPKALSTLRIISEGVAVAPRVSHIFGDCEIDSTATYTHNAKANVGIAQASLQVNPIYVFQASADVPVTAVLQATGHFEWAGEADIDCTDLYIEMYPAQRHMDTVTIYGCAASVTADPTRIQKGKAAMAANVELLATGYNTLHPIIDITGTAEIGSDYTVQEALQGAAAITATANADASAHYIFMSEAHPMAIAGASIEAWVLGNPESRDPIERTMTRPSVDRVMVRPFVDRTMKATR